MDADTYAAVIDHYSALLAGWESSDDPAIGERVGQLMVSFITVAEQMREMEFPQGTQAVTKWARMSSIHDLPGLRVVELLNKILTDLEGLSVVMRSLMKRGLPAYQAVCEIERPRVPDLHWPDLRAALPLLMDGRVTSSWDASMKRFLEAWLALRSECLALPQETEEVRGLLVNGMALTLASRYALLMVEYSWHLHVTDEEWATRKMHSLAETLGWAVGFLEDQSSEEC